MSEYVGTHREEPEFIEDVESLTDWQYADDDAADEALQHLREVLAGDPEPDVTHTWAPEQQDVPGQPQDEASPGPEPIPEPIQFAVDALMDHYTYDQICDAVHRLHEGRLNLTTAFSVYLTQDGSTLVNTEVPGVSVDREPSTEDMRRAARDVAEFHQHQRIASMVRAAL